MYFFWFVVEERLTNSMNSLVSEVTQLLQYVKDKFSEVLLPAEVVTKSSLLGKGVSPSMLCISCSKSS